MGRGEGKEHKRTIEMRNGMKDEVRKVKALYSSSSQIEANYLGRRRKGGPEEDI